MMTSNRPYLIRALFEWIIDNGLTPHLLVDATHPGSIVPRKFVEEGRIVLNISPSAVHGLVLGNDSIDFSARFGGVASQVELPPGAVLGIYARENGHGMLFPPDDDVTGAEPEARATTDESSTGNKDKKDGENKPKRPSLRVVK